MIGWNGNGVYRVLKIDCLDASELNLSEDSTAYTKKDTRRQQGHRRPQTGHSLLWHHWYCVGYVHWNVHCFYFYSVFSQFCFFFVLPIYVVSGFIKLLGPYYMLVITERREIGEICGHRVYEVSKSEIISLRNPSVLSNIANSRDKNRCLDLPYTILCLFCLFQAYCWRKFLFGEKRVSTCVYLLHPSTFV